MSRIMKSFLLAGLGVSCFALGAPAQQAQTPQVGQPLFQPWPNQRLPNGIPMYREDTLIQDDSAAVRLAKQLAEAKTDAEKEKLKESLKTLLNQQFDERQKHHEKELAALEEKVKKIKEMVAKRQENKKEIIDEKTKQLEREAKGLGW
jgi:hypothetical protein